MILSDPGFLNERLKKFDRENIEEKRINDLYQLSFDKKQTNDDDPLIAKRPLFWSCVSCDIDTDKVTS